MRAAAARAASRRGSSTMIFLPAAHGSSSSASGTRVVLPAPGGATSTAALRARKRCGQRRQRVVDRQRSVELSDSSNRCHGGLCIPLSGKVSIAVDKVRSVAVLRLCRHML